MAIQAKLERQPLTSNWQHKIAAADIELKERQFMNDEFKYYKEIKTKVKKNGYTDSNEN
jgi:hypothetical protein